MTCTGIGTGMGIDIGVNGEGVTGIGFGIGSDIGIDLGILRAF